MMLVGRNYAQHRFLAVVDVAGEGELDRGVG